MGDEKYERLVHWVIAFLCFVTVVIIGLGILSLSHPVETEGLVIDKAHNVTTEQYYLYIRTEDGDQKVEVTKRTWRNYMVGEEYPDD